MGGRGGNDLRQTHSREQFNLRLHRGPVRYGKEIRREAEANEKCALVHKASGLVQSRNPSRQYNPDWGLVMEQVFGEDGPLLYLVRETKSTTVADDLRGTENQKIHCGERHFRGALGVDYRVVTSADDLP